MGSPPGDYASELSSRHDLNEQWFGSGTLSTKQAVDLAAENASKSSDYFPPAAVETMGGADEKDPAAAKRRFLLKIQRAVILGDPLPGNAGGMGVIVGHTKPTEGQPGGRPITRRAAAPPYLAKIMKRAAKDQYR